VREQRFVVESSFACPESVLVNRSFSLPGKVKEKRRLICTQDAARAAPWSTRTCTTCWVRWGHSKQRILGMWARCGEHQFHVI
jgi:hypothetical protein